VAAISSTSFVKKLAVTTDSGELTICSQSMKPSAAASASAAAAGVAALVVVIVVKENRFGGRSHVRHDSAYRCNKSV
jgi:hypothetical protein